MKFSIQHFLNKCGQIHNILRIWPYLLKKFQRSVWVSCILSIVFLYPQRCNQDPCQQLRSRALQQQLFTRSTPEVFHKKGFLRNVTKFTRKQLCQSAFFNKVAGLRCFPVNFVTFLTTPFLQNTSGDCFYYRLTIASKLSILDNCSLLRFWYLSKVADPRHSASSKSEP